MPSNGGVARVLFVTPEMSDFTRVGGLGEVSAALPRALRSCADVRVLIPGYTDVLASGLPVEVVGRLPAYCNIPPCDLGLYTPRMAYRSTCCCAPRSTNATGHPMSGGMAAIGQTITSASHG